MKPPRPTTFHQIREAHYVQFLGPVAARYDEGTGGVLAFAPNERRAFWTYVSSRMSSMGHGRYLAHPGGLTALELIAYSREHQPWVPGLMFGSIAALTAHLDPFAQRHTLLFEQGFPPPPKGPFFNSIYFTRPLSDRDAMPGLVVGRFPVEFRGMLPMHGRERHFAMEHSVSELDRRLAAGGAGYLLDVPRRPVV